MRGSLSRIARTAAVGLLALGGASFAEVSLAPAARATDGPSCADVTRPDDTVESPVTDPSLPLEALQVPDAQDYVRGVLGVEPGAGVTVAVVDSGVRDVPGALDATHGGPRDGKDPGSSRGTVAAGLIAGGDAEGAGGDGSIPVGIAPGATLVDQRVYDVDTDTQDPEQKGPDPTTLAEGLTGLVPQVRAGGRWIVNVSMQVTRTPELDAAIDQVTRAGAIVVAAAGDRDVVVGQSADGSGDHHTGEDYAAKVWPAGYARDWADGIAGDSTTPANPRVLSVTTTADADQEVTDYMVESSAIDLAVPTAGAVSYAVNAEPCSVYTPSTRIAAAEVSGILALLWSAFPDDRPEQLLARLLDTAAGSRAADPTYPDRLVGRGIAQPLAAVTSLTTPRRDGSIDRSTAVPERVGPVRLPVPEPDVLASTRSDAVWWGVFGGGALLLTLLLRPVLTRRRTTSRRA